jgi:ABC-2 type transport system permease protein
VASGALYLRLVGARLRGQLQYRASFLLQAGSSFTSTFVELMAIVILFRTFQDLAGWRVGEVALLYGLVSIAFGLTEMLGSGFDEASQLIRTGEFDRVLTRPVAPFVQVLAADVQLRRIGRIAQGVVAVALANRWLGLAWTLPKALVFLSAVLSSSAVFFTVLLVGAAICFWTVESSEVQNIFTYGGTELASYPLHIYNRWLQGAFLYFVPLALTSYYPVLYILGKPDPLGLPTILQFLAPLVAALFFAVGLVIWRLGLRHYQSTGS